MRLQAEVSARVLAIFDRLRVWWLFFALGIFYLGYDVVVYRLMIERGF